MHLPLNMARRLATVTNCYRDFSMVEFEITAAVLQIIIMAPFLRTPDAARNGYDNNDAMGWTERLSTLRSDIAGSLLHTRAFSVQNHRVNASIV